MSLVLSGSLNYPSAGSGGVTFKDAGITNPKGGITFNSVNDLGSVKQWRQYLSLVLQYVGLGGVAGESNNVNSSVRPVDTSPFVVGLGLLVLFFVFKD